MRAHSQGKACPTCGRSGGQPRGPVPKQNPPAPWETQRYEAREAWGLLLGCGGQSLPPRTLDPGPRVDGSAAWMGGTGRLTWERWDEQVVSGTGGSQLSPGADPHCGTQEGAVSCPSAKPEARPRERPPAGKELTAAGSSVEFGRQLLPRLYLGMRRGPHGTRLRAPQGLQHHGPSKTDVTLCAERRGIHEPAAPHYGIPGGLGSPSSSLPGWRGSCSLLDCTTKSPPSPLPSFQRVPHP